MRKQNRCFIVLGLLAFFLLCLVPSGQAQQGTPVSFAIGQPFQAGLGFCVGSSAACPASYAPLVTGTAATTVFNVAGLQSFSVVYKPAGTTSVCTFTVDGIDQLGNVTTGGIQGSQSCTSAGNVSTSSATQYVQAKISYNITTTGSVLFTFYGCTSSSGCGGGTGSSVSVSNFPSSQNVVCTSGCNGANASVGTAGGAAPTSATYVGGSNGGNIVPWKMDLLGDGDVNLESAIPAGSNVIGGVTTQPTGFSSSPLGNQVAVTGTAANLGSNSTHGVCITALIANTIPVYVGGSGVTTSNGWPLNPGDFYCWQVNNTNLLYVVASTTGASIAWSAN